MSKPKVVISHWVHAEVLELLEQACVVMPNQSVETLPPEELIERCRDAEALLAFMPDSIDALFLAQCPNLKIIAGALKGYDNFDIQACRERGVLFSIVPDLLTEPTAELAIALMLGLARNLLPGDRLVRSGAFAGWRPVLYGTGLSGSRVGIIGMGAIGQAIAVRLTGFGCLVTYHDLKRLPAETERALGAVPMSVSALLQASDMVVVALPLTPLTHHLIDEIVIADMKSSAYLINIGRGSVVCEAAVANALAEDRLAGYAADVFEFEDWQRPDRPWSISQRLLSSKKTLFTPHLGSAVASARRDIALEAARNIVEALAGKRSSGAVTSGKAG